MAAAAGEEVEEEGVAGEAEEERVRDVDSDMVEEGIVEGKGDVEATDLVEVGVTKS